MYQLYARQVLPIAKLEAWQFLSDPNNLQVITPDYMKFKILSGAGNAMYPGQIIQYKVSPFAFYTTTWVTEITHVKEYDYFVDEQRSGPYALWHHKHFLSEVEGGVAMEDIVDYKLPLGYFGQMAHFMVKKQLQGIFDYRREKLKILFGELKDYPTELRFSNF